jgi:hypothetical protein
MDRFTVGTLQEAAHAGLTADDVRGPRFVRLTRNLYADPAAVATLPQRCAALSRVLPEVAVFCHGTAACLHALPLPTLFADDRIHVAVPAGTVVPNRANLVSHALLLPEGHVVDVDGVRVTSAARTFLDLAPALRETALIALGDAVLRTGLATADELGSVVASAARRRGVVRARSVLPRLDERAESPPESMTRVWSQDEHLPEVTPQAVIYDDNGAFVARVDLLYEEYKVVVEYEGSHHRTAEQYAQDLARRNKLVALGYLVVHLDASTLDRTKALRVITAALRQRGWVPQPR